jgi:hypothetical protein
LVPAFPLPAVATVTGLVQVVPPFVDRLATTAAPVPAPGSGSDTISHVLWAASKATLGSLTRANVPPAKVVIPGRNPLFQELPPSPERAQPMFDAPPSKNRPTWNADTIVDPDAKVSGSTSVACWLVLLVYGSLLRLVSVVAPVANVSVVFTPFGPTQTKSLQDASLPHAWYSYRARWASAVASWNHATSPRCPTLIVGPFVHVLVPTRRQRMNAEQLWSQEPTAFRRAE